MLVGLIKSALHMNDHAVHQEYALGRSAYSVIDLFLRLLAFLYNAMKCFVLLI